MSEHLKLALEALDDARRAMATVKNDLEERAAFEDGPVALGNSAWLALICGIDRAAETYTRLSKESASALEGRTVTDEIDYNAVVEEVAGIVRQHLRAVQGFTFHPVYVDETVREPLTEALKRFHESALAMQPPQPTTGASDG